MKIFRIAFKDICPQCKHSQELTNIETIVFCENCGGSWEPTMFTKKEYGDERVFDKPPVPYLNDRSIRS